jgi:hypothetical protein
MQSQPPTGRGHVGVQTFAGLGEIDLSGYRHPTGALDRRTARQGLSCDRQDRCQYANDLKWPVRPSQASLHNTPERRAPRLLPTHTTWRIRPATSHTAIAALDIRTRYYCHTCPARTLGKDRQALGRLCDGDTMIPWRPSATGVFAPGRHPLPAPDQRASNGCERLRSRWF